MAANTFQRKAQAISLAAKVAEYQAWWLITDCGSCGPRDIPLATLLPEQTISQVLRRLRCQSCCGRSPSLPRPTIYRAGGGVWCGFGGREAMGEKNSTGANLRLLGLGVELPAIRPGDPPPKADRE